VRILVVGGTRFVGRHIVAAALERGHDVTLLHRGSGDTDPFSEAEHLHLDRDGDLSVLDDRTFDATVDTSAYFPEQAMSLADALGDRAGRYLVISSVSAYDVPEAHGFDETSRLLEPTPLGTTELTGETYGRLKVAVEDVAHARYGDRGTVVRPTYVVGPFDHTGRFTYWVERIAEGGEVLAPGDPSAPTQVIDGRDLGAWIVRLIEDDVAGDFHAVSPAPPYGFGDLLRDVVDAVGPAGTTLTWVDGAWLLEQGEDGATLPLWGEDDPAEAMLAADPSKAHAAGLAPRPIADTVRDTLESARLDSVSAPPRLLAGGGRGPISREREAELLAAWHARTP